MNQEIDLNDGVPESFAAQVWRTLSSINVNEFIEKKANLSYLSWSWAWSTLMHHYPESEFQFGDPVIYPDGTVEIRVAVTVQSGDNRHTRECWLPVMDNRNNAIPNPDARKVSDTKMRCLVKCLALHGLGMYIYAGEDLPQAEVESIKAQTERRQKIAEYIKSAITRDDAHAVVEEWHPLPEDEKRALWVAETKGGYFSQAEKQYIKTAMFQILKQTEEAA